MRISGVLLLLVLSVVARAESPPTITCAVPLAQLPIAPDVVAQMEVASLTPRGLVERALEGNPIGTGGNAQVFDIPGLPGFVLRAPHAAVAEARRNGLAGQSGVVLIPDYAPHFNFGQVVGTIGPFQILRRQRGRPAGMPYGVDRNNAQAMTEATAAYRERVREAAAMPAEAYDALVEQVVWLNQNQRAVDPSKSGNLLIDAAGNRFNLVDINSGVRTGNSVGELVSMLMDNANASRLNGDPSVLAQRQQIIRSLFSAARRGGLAFESSSTLEYSFELAGMNCTPQELWNRP